ETVFCLLSLQARAVVVAVIWRRFFQYLHRYSPRRFYGTAFERQCFWLSV
ncbi:unnamed protein product, partial [Amoebophrya sp. A120]